MTEMLATAHRVMPGGTFGSYALPLDVDLVIKSGNGSKVYDVDGREYLDCVNGSGPMILGHAHPHVVEKLREAVVWPSNSYLLNEQGVELAEQLVSAIPCAEQIKFAVTGSDATLYAMRLARGYTGRDKILKFEGGFLGSNDYALMNMRPAQPLPDFPKARRDAAGVPRVLEDEVLIAPYNDLAAVERIVKSDSADLAAIVIEAQQRSIEPAPGFLEGLRRLCDETGVLLIFDEVVTGFRLAWGGAQEVYGVLPDLAAYGKIIGGGLPLAAVAGRADIMQLADPRRSSDPRYCFIGGTTSGNPLATVAGLATLDVLRQPGSYERLHEIGDRFRRGSSAVFKTHGVPAEVIGTGPLAQYILTDRPVTDYRSSIAGDVALQRKLNTEMVRRGVLTHGKFYFSLAMSDDDITRAIDILDESLSALRG